MILLEDLKSLSDAELDKIIQEKKKNLKSNNLFSPLDKFTKIDDLLRENIKQQHLTNQLLLALYYKKEKDGKIVPIQPNRVDTSAILEGFRGDDIYRTIVRNIENPKITGSEKVFEIQGSGILAEVKFQSSNSTVNNRNYGVRIVSDKSMIYQDTWANFFNRSFHETDLSCWEDIPNSCYLLVFQKIAFAKNLMIEVYGSTATFSNIYLKYHLKVV